jgi:hypothetical protein
MNNNFEFEQMIDALNDDMINAEHIDITKE